MSSSSSSSSSQKKHSICSGLVAMGTPLAARVAGVDVSGQMGPGSVDNSNQEFQVHGQFNAVPNGIIDLSFSACVG